MMNVILKKPIQSKTTSYYPCLDTFLIYAHARD
jgi:hypothetical protein